MKPNQTQARDVDHVSALLSVISRTFTIVEQLAKDKSRGLGRRENEGIICSSWEED
jgi:hypothetical protein